MKVKKSRAGRLSRIHFIFFSFSKIAYLSML